jgi:hypothetical protein
VCVVPAGIEVAGRLPVAPATRTKGSSDVHLRADSTNEKQSPPTVVTTAPVLEKIPDPFV